MHKRVVIRKSSKWRIRRTFLRVEDVEPSRGVKSKLRKLETSWTRALQHIKHWIIVCGRLLILIFSMDLIKYHKRSVLQYGRVTAFVFSNKSVFNRQIYSFSSSLWGKWRHRFSFTSFYKIEQSKLWKEGKVELPIFSNT